MYNSYNNTRLSFRSVSRDTYCFPITQMERSLSHLTRDVPGTLSAPIVPGAASVVSTTLAQRIEVTTFRLPAILRVSSFDTLPWRNRSRSYSRQCQERVERLPAPREGSTGPTLADGIATRSTNVQPSVSSAVLLFSRIDILLSLIALLLTRLENPLLYIVTLIVTPFYHSGVSGACGYGNHVTR